MSEATKPTESVVGNPRFEVTVNGEPREVPAGTTVAELARLLELPETGVAIAVDDEVIVAGRWDATELSRGAQIDVLTAVQGG